MLFQCWNVRHWTCSRSWPPPRPWASRWPRWGSCPPCTEASHHIPEPAEPSASEYQSWVRTSQWGWPSCWQMVPRCYWLCTRTHLDPSSLYWETWQRGWNINSFLDFMIKLTSSWVLLNFVGHWTWSCHLSWSSLSSGRGSRRPRTRGWLCLPQLRWPRGWSCPPAWRGSSPWGPPCSWSCCWPPRSRHTRTGHCRPPPCCWYAGSLWSRYWLTRSWNKKSIYLQHQHSCNFLISTSDWTWLYFSPQDFFHMTMDGCLPQFSWSTKWDTLCHFPPCKPNFHSFLQNDKCQNQSIIIKHTHLDPSQPQDQIWTLSPYSWPIHAD